MVGEILALSASFFIGLTTVLAKKGIQRTNSTTALLALTIAGTVLFWAISLPAIPLDFFRSKAFFYFALAGVFSPALVRWLFFISLDRVGTSISSSILATGPAFAALIAWVLLKERPTLVIGAGIVLIIVGIVAFQKDLAEKTEVSVRKKVNLVLPLLSACMFGLALVIRKMGLNMLNSPLFGVTVGFTTSLLIYSVVFLFSKTWRDSISLKRDDMVLFCVAGLSLGAGWITLFYALSYGQVAIVASLANLHPLVVVALSYFLMGDIEKLTRKIIFGVAIVVVGVVLITMK